VAVFLDQAISADLDSWIVYISLPYPSYTGVGPLSRVVEYCDRVGVAIRNEFTRISPAALCVNCYAALQ